MAYLDLRQVLRLLGYVHPLQPNSNGPGGHNDHSVAISSQLYGRLNYQGKYRQYRLVSSLIDYRGRTDLDYDRQVSRAFHPGDVNFSSLLLLGTLWQRRTL